MIDLYIHRVPMKNILRCVVRKYSLYHALDVLNKEWGTDYTEADVVDWKHITQEDAYKHFEELENTKKV